MSGKIFATFALVAMLAGSASAETIAYWNQNSNNLPGGGFGFTPTDFPQAADLGNGELSLANFDMSTSGVDGAYTYIASFGGTTENAQNGDPSGGSISPQGGDDGNGAQSNNGMQMLLSASTVGFTDISVSWAQRGTSTGFTSRVFAYSTDGGANFTDVSFAGDSGVLTITWTVESPDLTAVSGLADNSDVVFGLPWTARRARRATTASTIF